MRAVLFGLNMAALAAAVVPAVMIYDSMVTNRALDPITGETFFILLGGGVFMCVSAAAALTKQRSPNPRLAMRLLSVGAVLFIGAIGWSLALYFAA